MSVIEKIIIDCDPGCDDAVALLFAMASEKIDILAITTVAANVSVDMTTINALKITELANRQDIPVYRGCHRPFMRLLRTADDVHGESGMGKTGERLPPPKSTEKNEHAVDALIRIVMTNPGQITLCVLGSMTNIAMAILKEPDFAKNVKRLVFMGGAINGGNVNPVAEFNIFVDPHAAHLVFHSGIRTTMIGLDVTHQVHSTPARLEKIKALNSPVADAVHGILTEYGFYDIAKYGWEGGPLHDPCVIAYLLEPDIFSGRDCYVDVEYVSEKALGQTIVDWWNYSPNPHNMHVLNQVDADRFYHLLTDHIQRYPLQHKKEACA